MKRKNHDFYEEENEYPQEDAYLPGEEIYAGEYADGYEGEYSGEYEGEYEDAYIVEEMDEPDEGEGEYLDYGDEAEQRFHGTVSLMDMVSLLIGVGVILVLTALMISIVSWLREDLIHSFVLLQSGIQ